MAHGGFDSRISSNCNSELLSRTVSHGRVLFKLQVRTQKVDRVTTIICFIANEPNTSTYRMAHLPLPGVLGGLLRPIVRMES